MGVLVTGGAGMLGKSLINALRKKGEQVVSFDLPEGDVCNAVSVEKAFRDHRPQVVFHLAAYTDVDRAEEERECAYSVNVTGSENAARAAKNCGAKIVYISTDYVFGGGGELPWRTEDEPSPVNFYGWSKHEGEKRVCSENEKSFIVRTAWVFGDGKNFVRTMLAAAKSGKPLRVVDDQIGSPTYADDLSGFLIRLAETEKYGVYHATNEGFCSWYAFARAVFSIASEIDERYRSIEVLPVGSEGYPLPAKRPKNSRLDKGKLEREGFTRLPNYEEALRRYLLKELDK